MLRNRNLRAAVTLFEILIVLSIMSISLLFTLPAVDRWLNWSDRVRFETMIRDAVQQARVQAVLEGYPSRIRPDRLSSSLRIEIKRDTDIETVRVISIPKRVVILLKRLETGESVPSIDIDPHGLFPHAIRIEVNSDGQLYSWMTDRQTGMIKATAK